jgi:uncharacterized protein with GYD domain
MAKYMYVGSYTASGAVGLHKDGGSKRRDVIAALAKQMGGTMESFYYAFGSDDVFVVFDLPDNVTVAALSIAVGASGSVTGHVVVLLTPEEIDAATKKTVNYRKPGA